MAACAGELRGARGTGPVLLARITEMNNIPPWSCLACTRGRLELPIRRPFDGAPFQTATDTAELLSLKRLSNKPPGEVAGRMSRPPRSLSGCVPCRESAAGKLMRDAWDQRYPRLAKEGPGKRQIIWKWVILPPSPHPSPHPARMR
jgi:hypothetical protein